MGVNTDGMCPVCGREVESIYHAIFKCVGLKNVWEQWKECPMVIGVENMDFSDLALKDVREWYSERHGAASCGCLGNSV